MVWQDVAPERTHWTQGKQLIHGGIVLPYKYLWHNGQRLSNRQTNIYNALSFDVDNAISYHGEDVQRVMDVKDVRARFLHNCFAVNEVTR